MWSAQREVSALHALREPTDVAVRSAKARFAGGTGSAGLAPRVPRGSPTTSDRRRTRHVDPAAVPPAHHRARHRQRPVPQRPAERPAV